MVRAATAGADALPAPGAHYLLPFGALGRFLFKMDFAEAEYIARVRSGVKGTPSGHMAGEKEKPFPGLACGIGDERLSRFKLPGLRRTL